MLRSVAPAVGDADAITAVSDPTGRPLMLFNSEGKTVWTGDRPACGGGTQLPHTPGHPDPRGELDAEATRPAVCRTVAGCRIRAGDYNRFRYYEPETGCTW